MHCLSTEWVYHLMEHCSCLPQLIACLVLPALVCAAVYVLSRPASISIAFAAGMAGLYAALLSATRLFLLEQQYTVRCAPPACAPMQDTQCPQRQHPVCLPNNNAGTTLFCCLCRLARCPRPSLQTQTHASRCWTGWLSTTRLPTAQPAARQSWLSPCTMDLAPTPSAGPLSTS